MSSKKYVLVTGVSTGIGYGVLKELVNRGYHVFGSVRKIEDQNRLLGEFSENFTPLLFDVTDAEAIKKASQIVADELGDQGLVALVNNSGIAIGGPLQHQDIEVVDRHFQVNVVGLMRVTQAFLPFLGARENHKGSPGKIINISSVAGKFAQPFVGAYVASKHAVEGLSASLRRELLLFGIDVVIVGPGAVVTPIWDKGIRMKQYEDTAYGKILNRFARVAQKGAESGLTIEFLGQKIADIIEHSKPKLRYAFVPNKFQNWTLLRLMPARFIDRMIRKRLMKLD